MKKQLALGAVGAILVTVAAFFLGLRMNLHPENQKPGKFPEQLVYVRAADDVVDGGVLFASPSSPPKSLAIIWVHGWGVNFYFPSYVGIGRELATRGFPTISVFFGTQTPDAAITRVTCPVLAFFGSKDDIGGEKELALLTSSVRRLAHGPAKVDTAIIANGNHEYVGEEAQVAQLITRWIETEVQRR